jgi:hypothetical protein
VHFLDPNSPQEPVPALGDIAPLAQEVPPAPSEVDLIDVLLIAIAALGALFLVGTLAAAAYIMSHRSLGMNPKVLQEALGRNAFFIVPTQLVTYLVIIGFMAILVRIRHRNSLLQAVHWNPPSRRYFVNALMVGAALALVSDIGEVVLHRWIPDSLPITEYFKDRPSALLLGAFGVLVAPLMEELMFRGFIYPALARWRGASISVLITAFCFTLLHGAQLGYSWAPLLLIFIVGVTLTVTRRITNSVATCVVMHMTYNFVLLAQTYIFTHGFRQMQGT